MAVFSTREYIKQFERLKPQDQEFVKEAIEVIKQDPNHVDFNRPYLNPYKLKQFHPISNKQLTLFFEVLGNGNIFLRWLNDYKYLHNTWGNGEDPCIKGLEKFLASAENLTFDPNVHGFLNNVNPRTGDVIYISTTKLQVQISTNPYKVDTRNNFIAYSVGVFDLDDDNREMNSNYLDFKEFLLHVYDYFKNKIQGNFSFEFADEIIEQYIVDGILAAADPSHWEISYDAEHRYTVVKMK